MLIIVTCERQRTNEDVVSKKNKQSKTTVQQRIMRKEAERRRNINRGEPVVSAQRVQRRGNSFKLSPNYQKPIDVGFIINTTVTAQRAGAYLIQ